MYTGYILTQKRLTYACLGSILVLIRALLNINEDEGLGNDTEY